MKVRPCTSRKIVSFYLTKEEAEDQTLKADMKTAFAKWKQKGYLPVVFIPGTESLEDELYDLMKRNLRKFAEKDDATPYRDAHDIPDSMRIGIHDRTKVDIPEAEEKVL